MHYAIIFDAFLFGLAADVFHFTYSYQLLLFWISGVCQDALAQIIRSMFVITIEIFAVLDGPDHILEQLA